MMRIVFVLLL
jgi:hypothetical protein